MVSTTTEKQAATEQVVVIDSGRKRDRQGRRIVTAEERTALMTAYRKSGMTQRAFVEREGLRYSTFTSWLQGRRRAGERHDGPSAVRFTEVKLPGMPEAGLLVRLPDGTELRGGSAAELAVLVRAIRG